MLDVRLATIPTAFGEKLTCRLLDRSARILTLEELGFPEEALKKYRKLVILPYGFILVTGRRAAGRQPPFMLHSWPSTRGKAHHHRGRSHRVPD